jgi:hypothetical protein
MRIILFLSLLSLLFVGGAFRQDVYDIGAKKTDDTLRYIFLGHVYRYNNPGPGYRVDPRIEDLDYSDYSRIWLGGDVCSEAFLDRETLVYIDSVFDLNAPGTQYAIGNHDIRNGNIQYYREFTGRKSYNVFSENGIVSICLNSQLNPSQCEDLNSQFDLIKNVCDTIQNSSHLFLLMHNCLFSQVPNMPATSTFAHSNFGYWNANCKSSDQTFLTAIYPMLEEVKSRGIVVHCIMGDSGTSSKAFHQESTDSIHFFASGISNTRFTDSVVLAQQPRDRVLVFEHILATDEVTWEFQELDSLFNAQ